MSQAVSINVIALLVYEGCKYTMSNVNCVVFTYYKICLNTFGFVQMLWNGQPKT